MLHKYLTYFIWSDTEKRSVLTTLNMRSDKTILKIDTHFYIKAYKGNAKNVKWTNLN